MERERLGSRLGFILLSAGCAIGIGNVWRFPYMVGENGGGIFIFFYILFLVCMGLPIMTMEFAMGRASQKSPVKFYQQLEPKGSKWHLHGYMCLGGNILIMMFLTTIAGWMIIYAIKMLAGDFVDTTAADVSAQFSDVLSKPHLMLMFVAIVCALGVLVCIRGIKNGVEKVTKIMMIILMAVMGILVVNSLFMDGAAEGLKFLFAPDERDSEKLNIASVVLAALNQSFYTLGLGVGCMGIFGSYIGKEKSLLGESLNIVILDTIVAIAAGLIIFPACFTYGIQVDSGPSLVFITLPNVFSHMTGGRIFGALFFVFMSFAALSTAFATVENITACFMDLRNWNRKKACLFTGIITFALSVPCVLGFNVLKGFKPFGEGSSVLDLEDFIMSNIFFPVGCLVFVLFCTSKFGWGWKKFLAEANEGKGLKIAKGLRPYMAYIMPAVIVFIMIFGLATFNYT